MTELLICLGIALAVTVGFLVGHEKPEKDKPFSPNTYEDYQFEDDEEARAWDLALHQFHGLAVDVEDLIDCADALVLAARDRRGPDKEKIARVCHEVNRAYCEAIGDTSQQPWDHAEGWQRDSAIRGVAFALDNPESTAESQHGSWMADKVAAGWKLGPVKDASMKEHPCLVPYSALPLEQKVKDHLFRAVVQAMVR